MRLGLRDGLGFQREVAGLFFRGMKDRLLIVGLSLVLITGAVNASRL
jgi:hypothetical protein